MKWTASSFLGTALILIGAGLSSCHRLAMDPDLERFTVSVKGQERVYYARRPSQPPEAVIFAFHGAGGEPRRFDAVAGGLRQAAQDKAFLVIYPEGLDRSWNDGRAQMHADHDDVAFFDSMLIDVSKRFEVSTQKVFATGISNGGFMSFRLACERSHKLGAIAVVAAGMSRDLAAHCQPSQPVSILQFFGSADPVIPAEGGPIRLPFTFRTRGEVLSQDAGWDLWRQWNHCSGQSQEEEPSAKGAAYPLKRFHWTGCPVGVEGERTLIQGAGHVWPGGVQYLPQFLVGPISPVPDTNQLLVNFFARHR